MIWEMMMKVFALALVAGAGLRLGWEAMGSFEWLVEQLTKAVLKRRDSRKRRP